MGLCRVQGLGFRVSGLEGVEKKMETTVMGYVGTTIRIHSFFPSLPKVSLGFKQVLFKTFRRVVGLCRVWGLGFRDKQGYVGMLED